MPILQEKKGGKRLSSAVHFPACPTWLHVPYIGWPARPSQLTVTVCNLA